MDTLIININYFLLRKIPKNKTLLLIYSVYNNSTQKSYSGSINLSIKFIIFSIEVFNGKCNKILSDIFIIFFSNNSNGKVSFN